MADDSPTSSTPTAAAMAESLRSKTWRCLRSSHHLRTSQKLALLRRFLHSFSRLGDVESQLVLRYEILCLRESCGSTEMKVDTSEWSSFAEDCLSAGFPGNASKAFGKAISQTEGYQTTNVDPRYEVLSCLKHVQHIMMPEINGRFDKGSSNGSFSGSLREKSSTAVSRYSEGLKRKERAKLQMLREKNAFCID